MFRILVIFLVSSVLMTAEAGPKAQPSAITLTYNMMKSTADFKSFLVMSGIYLGEQEQMKELIGVLPVEALGKSNDEVKWIDANTLKMGATVITLTGDKLSVNGQRVNLLNSNTLLQNYRIIEKQFQNKQASFSIFAQAWAADMPLISPNAGAETVVVGTFAKLLQDLAAILGPRTSKPDVAPKPFSMCNPDDKGVYHASIQDSIGIIHKFDLSEAKDGMVTCIAKGNNWDRYEYVFEKGDETASPDDVKLLDLGAEPKGKTREQILSARAAAKMRKEKEIKEGKANKPEAALVQYAQYCHTTYKFCGKAMDLIRANQAREVVFANESIDKRPPDRATPQPVKAIR